MFYIFPPCWVPDWFSVPFGTPFWVVLVHLGDLGAHFGNPGRPEGLKVELRSGPGKRLVANIGFCRSTLFHGMASDGRAGGLGGGSNGVTSWNDAPHRS